MPISTERAKEACKAVILDDSERAQLLGRRDIIKVLESPLLSEDDKDTYIVDFLKINVAGEIRILCCHHAWLHAMLPTLYFAILNIFFLLHGQAVELVTLLELEVGIIFLFTLHILEPRLTVVVLHHIVTPPCIPLASPPSTCYALHRPVPQSYPDVITRPPRPIFIGDRRLA